MAAGNQPVRRLDMINDKRRYISRHPGNLRDKIEEIGDNRTGNIAADGYEVRYANPLPGTEKADKMYRRKDNAHSEHYACDGLMTDEEARFQRLYGDPD
jgi:hypothetical protein